MEQIKLRSRRLTGKRMRNVDFLVGSRKVGDSIAMETPIRLVRSPELPFRLQASSPAVRLFQSDALPQRDRGFLSSFGVSFNVCVVDVVPGNFLTISIITSRRLSTFWSFSLGFYPWNTSGIPGNFPRLNLIFPGVSL